ncbi:hypothetical protein HII31_05799 [Pseudocercospora fuligena]|uniref:Arrestin-like N-terminal domain-containing protein n=1 Tax=Pseudocercospora fuligena TaxID=685502 RepID=A0A8H6RJB6_9PEZI|nr:hypothetical protein HII31_05799 [Pseudocercospora fuligena]
MSASRLAIGGESQEKMSKLRNLYHAQKPEIKISLSERRSTYTTLDRLTGIVSITAPVDTHFDALSIDFVGTSRTYVERLTTAAAISGRSEAFHQFLKLEQPFADLAACFPPDRLLKAGRTYDFQFEFVIPEQLLPRVCQHKVAHPMLRELHTCLPPTFGDKDADSKAEGTEKSIDDMVPDMASVRYGVFVKICKDKEQGDDLVRTTIGSKATRVRVIPAVPEAPPLDTSGNSEYTMRKERTVKKGLLKGKLGTLVMEAAQPPSMRLRPRRGSDSETSMATIMLRFDPIDEKSKPPSLGSLTSKLKVLTYFASTARQSLPSKQASLLDLSQGLHTEQLNLSSRCVANVEWQEHKASDELRRSDSVTSTSSLGTGETPQPSETFTKGRYWTARIVVPINLPKNKAFVPTFHSCLISRVYQLKLELGLPAAGLGGTMDLKIPFQISCEGSAGPLSPRRGSVESAIEGVDISDDEQPPDFFEPRTIHIPSPEYQGQSRLGRAAPVAPREPSIDAPPGYSYFAPSHTARVPVF